MFSHVLVLIPVYDWILPPKYGGSDSKKSACNTGDPGLTPGSGGSPGEEKGMTIHSSILAWRIPWTKETGGLQSTASQSQIPEWLTQRWIYHIVYLFFNWWLSVSFTFWLQQITLLRMMVYRALCKLISLFLLDVNLGGELLDHRQLCSWGSTKLFPKQAAPFYNPTAIYGDPNFSTPPPTFERSFFFIRISPVGMYSYLIMF